jgi:hypothetical protein
MTRSGGRTIALVTCRHPALLPYLSGVDTGLAEALGRAVTMVFNKQNQGVLVLQPGTGVR